MKVVLFVHSLASDWNHGNAHFLRGLCRELIARGHEAVAYEDRRGWSRSHLIEDHGPQAAERYLEAYPELRVVERHYRPGAADVPAMLDGADLVIVHEWTPPHIVAAVGRHRREAGGFVLLFHDTHHRLVSRPAEMRSYDLRGYDGVLAFGRVLRDAWARRGWESRAFTWHEAADVSLFRPLEREKRGDLVWIGNWGDGERSRELRTFLIGPARDLKLAATVHGVRYPLAARRALGRAGIRYAGWLANVDAPAVLAEHRVTLHVPRRWYVTHLPGIPTIRIFEALACGTPLICSPWEDVERLFAPGKDYLVARDAQAMKDQLRRLLANPDEAAALAAHGLETVRARHTCAHRVDELLGYLDDLGRP